jgi:putative thioredoxin
LAIALHAAGDAQAAVDHLLELFRRDREWNDACSEKPSFLLFLMHCPRMIPLF